MKLIKLVSLKFAGFSYAFTELFSETFTNCSPAGIACTLNEHCSHKVAQKKILTEGEKAPSPVVTTAATSKAYIRHIVFINK